MTATVPLAVFLLVVLVLVLALVVVVCEWRGARSEVAAERLLRALERQRPAVGELALPAPDDVVTWAAVAGTLPRGLVDAIEGGPGLEVQPIEERGGPYGRVIRHRVS